jgi:hypothetical protein
VLLYLGLADRVLRSSELAASGESLPAPSSRAEPTVSRLAKSARRLARLELALAVLVGGVEVEADSGGHRPGD